MAWSNVSVGTPVGVYGTNPSINPTAPSGSGGILLLLCSCRETVTWPSITGWTAITSTSIRNIVYARNSDGGANDSPTFSPTTLSSVGAVITRWTGGNSTLGSLLNTQSSEFYSDSAVSPNGKLTVPAITPSANNCLVLRGGFLRNDDAAFTGAPSGDTLLVQHPVDLTSDIRLVWVYRVQTTAATVAQANIPNGADSSDGYSVSAALTQSPSVKYLKLLAHSGAASATGVEGVVLNSTRDTVIGEFSGRAFEASLESGEAVLLIPIEDITPDGSTLTTTDTPLVAAYNSTDGTVGLGSATVIEV